MGMRYFHSVGIILGYVQIVLGCLCFGVGVSSPAWSESQWVTYGSFTQRFWYGPWWYCKFTTGNTTSPLLCKGVDVDGMPPGDVLALLILSAVSVISYFAAFVLGMVLLCCCRSPGNASKWKFVSVLALIAGTTGLGSIIVFSISTRRNSYIFGFYVAMAGSFLAVTGGFTIAWSQLRYWRFRLGTPVSAANWDDLPRPYRRQKRRHPHSNATWDAAVEYPYSGYKIGTYKGTAEWVAHHS